MPVLYDVGVSYAVGHNPSQADLTVVGGDPAAYAVNDDDTSYVRMRAREDVSLLYTYLTRKADVSRDDLDSVTLTWRARAETTVGPPAMSVGLGADDVFLLAPIITNEPMTAAWTTYTATGTPQTGSWRDDFWASYSSVAVGQQTPCFLYAQVSGAGEDWVRLTWLAWKRGRPTTRVRQRQRDDFRQRQNESRQRTTRAWSYI